MKMMSFAAAVAKPSAWTVAVLLAGLVPAGVVYAAPAVTAASAAADTGGLEEIVVTAEKRNSTVQETAISMTAVSGEQLEAQGTKTVEDLIGTLPGVSVRTAGPGQTEYEMRGLGSSGGSTATVGFYLDETPLAASAVSLNGRTVIDPDLFDLNHAEVLRGPQGTLYGAGSMGGTIKLVTNQPKLGVFEGATSVDASQTDGGRGNGGGNLMLNLPIGEIAALRWVTTDKYISGWINRDVLGANFPFPTNPNCGYYFCTRGNVADTPASLIVKDANLERFFSTRAAFLVQPADNLSITTTLMYQRIDADGYNTYQTPPGVSGYALYQPTDVKEPYYDSFKLASFKVSYDAGFANLTSATSYSKRDAVQSQDSTESIQNIFNYSQFIPNLYVEEDTTEQFSEELRLTSSGSGPLEWVGGLFFTNLHSGYITTNQNVAFATALSCFPIAARVGNYCPPADQYNPNAGGTNAAGVAIDNPNGILFNDNNPNITKQEAVFGEISYKISPTLKATAGLRFYKFDVSNVAHQTGEGTATANGQFTCEPGTGPGATVGPGTTVACVFPTAHGSGTGLLPKVNLAYEPTPDLTVYGTVSKGSRPGGVNLPIPLTPGSVYYCGPAVPSQGVAASGPSYLTAQPSYYGSDNIWSFELGEKARFDDRRFTVNADVFYVKWTNIQQLIVLSCGYPYNTNAGDAKSYGPELEFSAKLVDGLTADITSAYTQAYISQPADRAGLVLAPGTRINNIPKYTATLALNYEATLADNLRGTARLSDSYVGPVHDVAYYPETLSPYAIVDGRVGVTRNSWSAYLFGTNLANKHAGLTIDNTVFAWQQPTLTRFSTNQPRTVGLEYDMKF